MTSAATEATTGGPRVADLRVVPVAGYDSMLLNLSGAHGPCFTRNVVLVTDTDGRTVRWHRALHAPGDWLPAHGGTGVLRPLGRGMLAVVTPRRIAAYRIADGDLRWVLPARQGCAFEPERAVHHGKALLLAQPCPHADWTAQLIAVDDLGRITPQRTPPGNEVGKEGGRPRPEHVDPEKVVARPR